jgi:hypothetical protein
MAMDAASPAEASKLCALVTAAATQGDCTTRLAERIMRQSDDVPAATAACAAIRAPQWQNECMFRVSEEVDPDQAEQAAALCAQAGYYGDQCYIHLLDRTAAYGAGQVEGRSMREAVAHLDDMASQLLPLVVHPKLERTHSWRAFWASAVHALVGEAARRGVLVSWRLLGQVFPAGDERLGRFQEELVVTWWRTRVQELVRAGEWPVPTAALLDLYDREVARAVEPALAPDAAPLYPPAEEPPADEPRGFAVLRLEDMKGEGPLATRFPVGASPWPLFPGVDCGLDRTARHVVLLLYALNPFPWEVARSPLEDALGHPQAAVRAYALDVLQEKAFVWQNQEASIPDWVLPAIRRVAESDPKPAVASRARSVIGHMEKGEYQAPTTGPQPGFCGVLGPEDPVGQESRDG